MMKFIKFLGWGMISLVLLASLAYAFLPTIGRILIAQELSNRGFTNIKVHIDRPSLHTLTIPLLVFHTSPKTGSTSIAINNTAITYSLDSLFNNRVQTVTIEQMKVEWNSSFLDQPPDQSSSLPGPQVDSQFALRSLASGLPVFPFQHLRLNHMEISNPNAPPTFQRVSLEASLDAHQERYEATIHLDGEAFPMNLLTFSMNNSGMVSFTGIHTNTPNDPVFSLETTLDRATSPLKLQGEATLKFHPFIQTVAALYPLPTEYQSLTGTFSGSWAGIIPDSPSPLHSLLDSIHGDFVLDAHLPTWPPFAQDIQLQTQGTVAVDEEQVRISVEPGSSGSANLAMGTFIPSAVESFLRHDDPRSVAWNIREPIEVETPIKDIFKTFQIPSGTVQLAVKNSSEQLDMRVSSKGLLLAPANKISGKADVAITSQHKPGPTSTWHPEEFFLEGDASIALMPNQIAISFNPSSYFRFSEMHSGPLYIPTLVSRFPQGAAATYLFDKKTLIVETTASSLALPSVFMQDQEWTFQEILTKNLSIQNMPESWAINGNSAIQKVQVPFEGIKIPDSNWQAQYSLNPRSIAVQFQAETAKYPIQVGGQLKLALLTGQGSGTLRMKPIQFAPETLVLSQLIQPWPNPNMDITHGTVSASAQVTFRKSLRGTDNSLHLNRLHGIMEFKEIGGFFKPTIMEGFSTRVEILGENESLRIPTTPLHIKKIQSAVEITKTSLLVSTETFHPPTLPTFSIRNMSTHLLGGTVSLPDTIIDPIAPTHEVTLQVTGLDLGEILRLEQQEAVQGTGTLDGTLPLFVSGKEVEVHLGSITARPPGGTLQFEVDKETAASWAQSQPNLDLIVKSLENYQYSTLEVGVDYEKNGILNLATRLEGKNPDFKKGVPIHFNLNIEENIPALMKSLSLIQDIEQSIEKKFQ